MEGDNDPLYVIKVIGMYLGAGIACFLVVLLVMLFISTPKFLKWWRRRKEKKPGPLTGDIRRDLELGNMPAISNPVVSRIREARIGVQGNRKWTVVRSGDNSAEWDCGMAKYESSIRWIVKREFSGTKNGELSVKRGDIGTVSSFDTPRVGTYNQ
jgi:hypothetical protein